MHHLQVQSKSFAFAVCRVLRVFPEYHVENKSALAAEKLRCPVIKHVQLSAKGEPIGHPPRGLVFFLNLLR